MIAYKNLGYYLITALIFLVLKWWYTTTATDNLFFLLHPVSKIVSAATGIEAVYIHGAGFYYGHSDVLINKSCSGFGFASICFLLLSYLTGKYVHKSAARFISTIASFVWAMLFSIVVNSWRIVLAISLKQNNPHLQTINSMFSHETIGAAVYLFFFITIYILCEYIFKTINKRYENIVRSKMAPGN